MTTAGSEFVEPGSVSATDPVEPSEGEHESARIPIALSASTMVLLASLGALLAIAVSTWGHMGSPLALTAAMTFALTLPALTWIDFTTYRLPNVLVAAAFLPSLVLVVADVLGGGTDPSRLWVAAVTGLGSGLFLLSMNLLAPGGMGMGDAKFMAVAAGLLAIKSVPVALTALFMFAPFFGVLIVPFVLMLAKAKGAPASGGRFAYGPYLVLAAAVGIFLPMDFSFPGT